MDSGASSSPVRVVDGGGQKDSPEAEADTNGSAKKTPAKKPRKGSGTLESFWKSP